MDTAKQLLGRMLVGIDGRHIGPIHALYLNDTTGEPEWVSVRTRGLLGGKVIFAPIGEVTCEGDQAVVTFEAKYVQHAPTAQVEGILTPAENDQLSRYYGVHHDQAKPSGSHDATRWGRD